MEYYAKETGISSSFDGPLGIKWLIPVYTPVWRGALWEWSVLPKNTMQCPARAWTKTVLCHVSVEFNYHRDNFFAGSFSGNKSSLTFLPWLPLSASDRHILSVTASRLQSRSSSLVSKSCEFLRDVLFKDFPAEIFLHRPSVLQVMKNLLLKYNIRSTCKQIKYWIFVAWVVEVEAVEALIFYPSLKVYKQALKGQEGVLPSCKNGQWNIL